MQRWSRVSSGCSFGIPSTRVCRSSIVELRTSFYASLERSLCTPNVRWYTSLASVASHEEREKLKAKYYIKFAGGPESPVEIREDKKKGRALYARYDITQGQLITAEKPFVLFPSERTDPYRPGSTDPEFHPAHCDHCLRRLKSTVIHTQHHGPDCDHSHSHPHAQQGEKCAECRVIYCSNECREEAWSQYHSLECKSLPEDVKKLEDHCRKDKRKFPLMAMRVMAKLLTEVINKQPSSWGPLQLLAFASEPAPEWAKDYAVFEEAFLNESTKKLFSQDWYNRLMQIFYVNCINVALDNEDNSKYGEKPVGSALYLLSSMYNHSCAPNTESSFPNSAEWHVRARRNISAGQEIFVSYVAPMIGKRTAEERREHLYSHYGFWCNCARCRIELEVMQKTREAVRQWKGPHTE